MAVKVEGTCDPKFNRVKAAFAENFEKRAEVGAAASVMLDGKSVVDIWAGHADKAKTRPWTTRHAGQRLLDDQRRHRDLRASVGGQGPARHRCAGREVLARVCKGGQGTIMPVRYLLSHRAGLPAVSKILDDNALSSTGPR